MATRACPLSCPHCLSDDPSCGQELSLHEVADLLDQIAVMQVPELLITGGEPMCRPDMHEVIGLLKKRQLHYSLNTAVMPNAKCQRAMRDWPPSFAAVSVDGPAAVHDAFRGRPGAFAASLEAIALYAELTGGKVAAGTTVTRTNFPFLEETFGEVLDSAASSWGLHLMVPEGRAGSRPELRLSLRQTKELLDLVTRYRSYFPVTLADEIGFCGQLEPLLRDTPFYCGAGRAQCVILPDGHVVPCTTTDRSTSAGSVRDSTLYDLWETGFADLRRYQARGRCQGCAYDSVCAGGCWLQRRHDEHCFRPAWEPSGKLPKALGAVCFGLAACAPPTTPATVTSTTATPATVSTPAASPTVSAKPSTDSTAEIPLNRCALPQLRSNTDAATISYIAELAAKDPALPAILSMIRHQRPVELETRAERIRSSMNHKTPSLLLASLWWRDLAEWCLDCTAPDKRSAAQRALVRDTMAAIGNKTKAWRLEVFRKRLDPFLFRVRGPRDFVITKAYRPMPLSERDDAQLKHWALPAYDYARQPKKITEAYLKRFPYAFTQRLTLAVEPDSKIQRRTPTAVSAAAKSGPFDVFDILIVPPGDKPVTIELTDDKTIELPDGSKRRLRGPISQQRVELPAGSEVSYPDVLRLIFEQHGLQEMGHGHGLIFEMPSWRANLVKLIETDGPAAEIRALQRKILMAWLF